MESFDQVCVVPWRKQGSEIEFCLITSVHNGDWIFPKGSIDFGEKYLESALRELKEEAGVFGQVTDDKLGIFTYQKQSCNLTVIAVLVHVDTCSEHWEEAEYRERCWKNYEKAKDLIQRPAMLELLDTATKRLTC